MTVQKISFVGIKPKMTPTTQKKFNEAIATAIGQSDKDLLMLKKNMKKTKKQTLPGADFMQQAEKFFSASLEFFQK